MPFPVAHSLVGASVAAAWRPQDSIGRDWKILLFAALLAVCPDFDFFFVWVLHLGRSWHRGFTHSIAFALAAGCLMLTVMGMSRVREAMTYGSAVLSHGLLDFSTTKRGGGVELFWPLSTARVKLGLIGISEFGLKRQPLLDTIMDVIKDSLIELVEFAPLLLIVLLLRRSLSASFRPSYGEEEGDIKAPVNKL